MQTDSLQTVFVRSTTHAITRKAGDINGQAPDVRHAAIVVRRMIRSADRRDQEVRERLGRAATVLKATRPEKECTFFSHPRDVVFRLAARLIRCLRS
jgi:hypothetical protein